MLKFDETSTKFAITLNQILWCHIRGGVESNEFRIDFYRIFWITFHLSNQSNHKFSNRTNFEPIQHLTNLTPPYSWSRIERISNWFSSNFSNIYCPFESIESQIIESNEFRTNSNLTPPLCHIWNISYFCYYKIGQF